MASPVTDQKEKQSALTEVDYTCCCFGRKVSKPPKPAPLSRGGAFSKSTQDLGKLAQDLSYPVKDANEVYSLKEPRHYRQLTRHPKVKPDGYDADSTQSTKEE